MLSKNEGKKRWDFYDFYFVCSFVNVHKNFNFNSMFFANFFYKTTILNFIEFKNRTF